MRPRVVVVPILLAAVTAACNCETESVQIAFNGTATGSAGSQAVSGLDRVSAAHIADYKPVRDFLVDDVDPGTSAVTWRVALTSYGFLGVTVPTSLRRGDVLPLTGVARVGEWGLASSTGPGVTASLQSVDGTFVTASAQGTVTVTGVDPLRLRIDAVFASSAGSTRAISGEAGFTAETDERECFT